jgi:uncharacterized membrane protein
VAFVRAASSQEQSKHQSGKQSMVDNLVNFVHLLAAVIWVGGAIYILFILQPALRFIEPQESGKLQGIITKRFSLTAWICIVILLTTGYLKTPKSMLFDASSDVGRMLIMKHILIVISIIVGLVIALHVVPTLQKNAPKPGDAPSADFMNSQKKLSILGWINLILGLLILLSASMLR